MLWSYQGSIESYSGKNQSSSAALMQYMTSTKMRGREISALIDFKEKTTHPAY